MEIHIFELGYKVKNYLLSEFFSPLKPNHKACLLDTIFIIGYPAKPYVTKSVELGLTMTYTLPKFNSLAQSCEKNVSSRVILFLDHNVASSRE